MSRITKAPSINRVPSIKELKSSIEHELSVLLTEVQNLREYKSYAEVTIALLQGANWKDLAEDLYKRGNSLTSTGRLVNKSRTAVRELVLKPRGLYKHARNTNPKHKQSST